MSSSGSEGIEHAADVLAATGRSAARQFQGRFAQHLPAATYTALFGAEQTIAELIDIVVKPEAPWLLSLEGIGGIGKTSLARGLIDALIEDGIIGWRTYSGLAWVTARRQQINAGGAARSRPPRIACGRVDHRPGRSAAAR
ncbi:MAG: hypothetical protein R2856_07490 [Caldilineaceae bacterium]